ncbi:ubiquitin-conjugating enzyme E2 O, partial [Cricetulus griseus]
LKLEDRSVVPRDVVRHMRSTDSQCGTVIDVNIDCAVKLIGTNCIIYPVNSKDLQHIWGDLDSLELMLPMDVNCHVGAETGIQVLSKSSH